MMGSIEDSLANYHGYFVLSVDEVNHVRTEWDVFSPFLIWRLPQAIPSKLVLVMTSNRIDWTSNLNPRVRSFLRADEILFRPYNALDIQQILKIRTRRALRPNALQAGVIEKISALASREHGDARKAVTLLARAARLAERSGSKITLKLVDQAGSDLEQDRYILMMRTSPVQLQATMAGVVDAWTNRKKASLNTGDVYDAHPRQIARHRHARSVSLLDGPKVRP
jgi:cell division control protein 6